MSSCSAFLIFPLCPLITGLYEGIGSVHRRLLVAYQNVLDLFLLEQLVVQGKDGTARVTENELDALFLKTANRDFGPGQFGGNAGGQFHRNTLSGENCCENLPRYRQREGRSRIGSRAATEPQWDPPARARDQLPDYWHPRLHPFQPSNNP